MIQSYNIESSGVNDSLHEEKLVHLYQLHKHWNFIYLWDSFLVYYAFLNCWHLISDSFKIVNS